MGDRKFSYFLLGGAVSLFVFLFILFLLALFLDSAHQVRRFVPQKSQTIEISLTNAPPAKKKRVVRRKKSTTPKKPAIKPRKKSSTSAKRTSAVARPKAIASLFKGVKVSEPTRSGAARLANAPSIRYRPKSTKEPEKRVEARKLISEIKLSKTAITVASHEGGRGDTDPYMTKLYEILYGSWHPEALYAGSSASVRLVVSPSGSFTYRIVRPSDNQGFNESLIEYLDMLQKRRLPPHRHAKPFVIDVEFKAKE